MIKLEMQDVQRIAEIVREETGNQVQEKNFSMIEARMRSYLDRAKHNSMAQYWKHFEDNEREERDAIAGLMTTHYTFFFREYLQFEVLEAWLKTQGPRLQQNYRETGKPFQVWSAACSRGHEVYSLGMFLELHLAPLGIPFQILGTDIDQESVAYAINGVYPLKEVNAIPNHYLAKHLRKGTGPNKEFAAIDPELRKRVKFHTANLMELPATIPMNGFDVIFCRNVFIYFSEEKVQKIATELSKRLLPNGLFFTGISEPLRFTGWGLNNFGPSVYEKTAPRATPSVVASTSPSPSPAKTQRPSSYKVLVVDDSPTIQKLMTKMFEKDPGCSSVSIANNGAEAKEMLAKGEFNLITLDIHMPVVNGIEFLQNHYRKNIDPPVIMVSSVNRSDLDLATKAMSLGAFDYIEKPSMNMIEKSANELLAKAKLALKAPRSAKLTLVPSATPKASGTALPKIDFDLQIGKKIVVPDASKCARLVTWKPGPTKDLEHLILGQKDEYRSPALVIVSSQLSDFGSISEKIQQWSGRELTVVDKVEDTFLRPNRVYLSTPAFIEAAFKTGRITQLSLQVLDPDLRGVRELLKVSSVQVLIPETLKEKRTLVESIIGRTISDITPATSFASLSVEYFAMLRSAAS